MTRYLSGALALTLVTQLAGAQCIQVMERDFEVSTNEIGSAVVEWNAELENQCRKTLDADLKIHLLNKNEEPVYELLDKTTLGVAESQALKKEVYIPSRIVDEVDGFAIEIVERERQY
ncbi:hypothetical protein F6455_11015 [Proteobacteria bacterium 005FR1]|nr:hypothetical protein [Proteobacteria bacterium 005FR1]